MSARGHENLLVFHEWLLGEAGSSSEAIVVAVWISHLRDQTDHMRLRKVTLTSFTAGPSLTRKVTTVSGGSSRSRWRRS